MSNICLILKKIDDKRYTSLITKYGNYIRASDFGKMTLHHIAGNDSETHELFQKMLNKKSIEKDDIYKNIIFSRMDNDDNFLKLYEYAYNHTYRHSHHWYTTRGYEGELEDY